jgi:hypothetical protein
MRSCSSPATTLQRNGRITSGGAPRIVLFNRVRPIYCLFGLMTASCLVCTRPSPTLMPAAPGSTRSSTLSCRSSARIPNRHRHPWTTRSRGPQKGSRTYSARGHLDGRFCSTALWSARASTHSKINTAITCSNTPAAPPRFPRMTTQSRSSTTNSTRQELFLTHWAEYSIKKRSSRRGGAPPNRGDLPGYRTPIARST